MLNMKKGLAIVLAAATALTFAPVSTLGLQGVVEAQAATKVDGSATVTFKADAVKDEEGATSNNTGKIVDNASVFTVTLKATGDSTIAHITGVVTDANKQALAGGHAADFTVGAAVTNLVKTSTQNITVTATSSAVTGDYYVELTNGTAKTYVPFHYTSGHDQDIADAAATVKATENAISGVDSNIYIQRSTGSSVTITPSYIKEGTTNNNANNYKFTVVGDSDIATCLAAKDSVPADKLVVNTSQHIDVEPANGSVKLTVDKDNTAALSGTIDAYLVAYKLDSSTGKYTPVAYNKVNINTYAVASDLVLSDKYNSGVSVVLGETTTDSILDNAKIYDATTGKEIASSFTLNSTSIAFSNEAIASIANGKLTGTKLGSETATITISYTAGGVNGIATKQLRVNVISNSSSVIKVTADGSKDAAKLGTEDAPIRLNVKTNKTFDLSKYVYVSDPANTTIAYKSDNNKNTVSDAGVVNATAAIDQFKVTVQAKDKKTGIVLASTDVYFRVNALPDDVLAVSGGSIAVGATVLSDTDYKYTSSAAVMPTPTEEKLAASQIHYVQLDVTGNETDAIQKDLKVTSANGAKLAYDIVYGKGSIFESMKVFL